jgi:tetratricopeptide (TPR) repeat protein
MGLRLAGALSEFWFYEGPISDGEQWISLALPLVDDVNPEIGAKLLNGAGMLAFARGDYRSGKRWNSQALTLAKNSGDKSNHAWSLFWLSAQSTSDTLEFDKGLEYVVEALDLFTEIDDKAGLAWSFNQVGEMSRLLGDFDRAEHAYQESMNICRTIGNRRREAIALTNLSYVAQHKDDFQKAKNYALDGLALLRDLGLEYHAAITLAMLAGPLSAQGKFKEAATLLGASQAFYERLSIQLQPADQVEVDGYMEFLMTEMGEKAYNSAREEGLRLSLEAAISRALALREDR